jgi:hypothetical protein
MGGGGIKALIKIKNKYRGFLKGGSEGEGWWTRGVGNQVMEL